MTDDQTDQAHRRRGKDRLERVTAMFENGSIFKRAEAYVNACLEGAQEGERAQFPNLAGFGRALGIGLGELQRLGQQYPQMYDAILAVLEDGALNTDRIPGKSALLAMNYFRRRLGYEPVRSESKADTDRAVRVIFDHDVAEDGA
jgi:hypothetical protein